MKITDRIKAWYTPERVQALTDPRRVRLARGRQWRKVHWNGDHLGYVYILRHSDLGDLKIGFSRNVLARFREIAEAQSRPVTLEAVLEGGEDVERALCVRFTEYRLRGEWFRCEGELALWHRVVRARAGDQTA